MKITDLTMTIEEGMITFPVPWHPFVEITQMGRLEYEKRETRKITLGTHTGTHMDAPRHFVVGGQTVDKVPLEQLCGMATILDFTHLPTFHEITKDEIVEKLAGKTPERVVLHYGWDKNVKNNTYYVEHPFLSPEAAQHLIDIGVRLIALDAPMPDDPKNGKGTCNDSPIHHIVLGSGCILVEYLVNVGSITSEEVELIVLPMKIKDGDGSPVRCIAIER